VVDVVPDFVHRLSYSDDGREVHNCVDPFECRGYRVFVANITDKEFDLWVEVVGSPVRVYLRDQGVERTDVVSSSEQSVGEVGADEPGASGDEDPHCRHPTTSVGR
jgi:hypothetical protein